MSEAQRLYHAAGDLYLQTIEQSWGEERIRRPGMWLARDPESADKMRRNESIGMALDVRAERVAGRSHNLIPRDGGDPRGEFSCSVMDGLLGHLRKFMEARKRLAMACFDGQAFGKIHGTIKRLDLGDGVLRNWWVPVRIEDQSQWRYRKRLVDPYADPPVAYWQRREILGPNRSRWVTVEQDDADTIICHTFADYEDALGYGRGLREQLGYPWYCLTHVNQEQLGAIERFARGWIMAKIDRAADADTGKPNSTVMSAWATKLEKMQSRHVLVMSKDDEVEVLKGSFEGWQMMDAYIDRMERRIDRLVNHAQLPTGGAADTGSLARAEVEESSSEALWAFDRICLEETLEDDLLTCCWRKNWPNIVALHLERSMPRLQITVEHKTDPAKLVTVYQGAHQMGLPIAEDDMYERFGIRKPDPSEKVLAAPAPADPFGGFGTGVPGFGTPAGNGTSTGSRSAE